MKLISSLLVVGLLTGCSCFSWRHPQPRFYKVTTADFEGHPVAEWICEGKIHRVQDGYHFWAMQRRIFKPRILEFHYPFGRDVTVNASNVIIAPTCEPLWLARIECCGMPEAKTVDPLDP